MAERYRGFEEMFARTQEARQAWEETTRQQRHDALAAHSEYMLRHPDSDLPPLKSAEPPPLTDEERAQLRGPVATPQAPTGHDVEHQADEQPPSSLDWWHEFEARTAEAERALDRERAEAEAAGQPWPPVREPAAAEAEPELQAEPERDGDHQDDEPEPAPVEDVDQPAPAEPEPGETELGTAEEREPEPDELTEPEPADVERVEEEQPGRAEQVGPAEQADLFDLAEVDGEPEPVEAEAEDSEPVGPESS